MMLSPRSVRNNNPGNIRIRDAWQGLIPRDQMTPEQRTEAAFCVFKAPEWGFRAMAILLRNYGLLYRLNTVRAIIRRWAPREENDTESYIKSVAERMDVASDEPLRLNDRPTMFALIKAITIHETGSWEPWWKDEDLTKGLSLAGI